MKRPAIHRCIGLGAREVVALGVGGPLALAAADLVGRTGPRGAVAAFVLAALPLAFLAAALTCGRVVVGLDGVALRTLFGTRFLSYDEVASFHLDPSGSAVEALLVDGTRIRFAWHAQAAVRPRAAAAVRRPARDGVARALRSIERSLRLRTSPASVPATPFRDASPESLLVQTALDPRAPIQLRRDAARRLADARALAPVAPALARSTADPELARLAQRAA